MTEEETTTVLGVLKQLYAQLAQIRAEVEQAKAAGKPVRAVRLNPRTLEVITACRLVVSQLDPQGAS